MKIQSNQGFSLLELTISTALLSVVMLGFANMMAFNAKAQQSLLSTNDIHSLFDRVGKVVNANWSCTAAFAGARSDSAIVVKDPADATKTIIQEQMKAFGHYTVSVVRMQNVIAVPNQAGVFRGTLHMEVLKNKGSNVGSQTLSRDIQDIYFDQNADGTIAHCYDTTGTVANAISTCTLLGGTWNAAAKSGAQCVLNNAQNTSTASSSTPSTTTSTASSSSNDGKDSKDNNGKGKDS